MVDLNIRKDGYVSGRQLETILTAMADEVSKAIEVMGDLMQEQKSEIKKLRMDLEAERRLRLSMKPR